jgi:hypothetical protein
MLSKKLLLAIAIGIGAVAYILFLFFIFNHGKLPFPGSVTLQVKQPVSPPGQSAFSTQPIQLSGTIERISGNVITVRQSKASFDVTVPDTASVVLEPVSIPYLFKPAATLKPKVISLKDVRVGMSLGIAAQENLQTLKGNTLTANELILTTPVISFTGTIKKISGSNLEIEAPVPVPSAEGTKTEQRTFQVSIASDTEISYVPGATGTETPKAQLVPASALKTGLVASVWTDTDVRLQQNITALRIQPNMPAGYSSGK